MLIEKLNSVLNIPSPLEKVHFSLWEGKTPEIYFKRDDLIHPIISGNKWRKFEGHLKMYFEGDYAGILTFGGAFSNHIIAVAAACQVLQIPSVGIIRGEIDEKNPALHLAQECGMKLIAVSRSDYREKDLSSVFAQYSELPLDKFLIVPEGGAGEEGLLGCQHIVEEINLPFDLIVTACGTGTTLAGIVAHLKSSQFGMGISVLKGADTMTLLVRHLSQKDHFKIISGYHFGGYARKTDELVQFAKQFTQETQIPLDFVYTAKMVYAFHDLLMQGKLDKYQKIVLLHTGGLKNAPIV